MKKILLIVPCYNESTRLIKEPFLAERNSNRNKIHFLFANDGSKDTTKSILTEWVESHPDIFFLYSHPTNLGKAEIIRKAFIYANEEQQILKNYDWIGFWDADLAIPLWEVHNMINYVSSEKEFMQDPIWGVFGCRVHRLGSQIDRSTLRYYLGRIFASMISLSLGIRSYDSQCGAKLFSVPISRNVFKDPFISRWIFDVEILLRMQQKNVIEYPLKVCKDIPGSKISLSREFFKVLSDIIKIRKYYKVSIHKN